MDINISEASLLAALPKAPSKYNPYKNYATVEKRKNWVLKRMFENGLISKKQLKQSLNYKIKLRKKKLAIDMTPAYFVEEIRKNLIERYGEKKIYKQGFYI